LQAADPLQDVGEQCTRHGNLGQLEGYVPPVLDHLRIDLHPAARATSALATFFSFSITFLGALY